MTNIYLDINGVLLTKDLVPAEFSSEFIKYVVTNNPTYWLTTHCRQRENYTTKLLSRYFSKETMKYINQIVPTKWDVFKTEAIDFSVPFLWFDDNLFEGEKLELTKHNVLDNWICVDLSKNPNQLNIFLKNFPLPIQNVSQ